MQIKQILPGMEKFGGKYNKNNIVFESAIALRSTHLARHISQQLPPMHE
ncbi:hypothetical protein NIASO_03770 [Niabella soli DSM 19437]|uniref:Uncharacterized protein n=1 Tax=Niabella soli DSM 19437 TaxID=929713 RepID=W0F2F0_9BACT|nr:hypothetical protein NIASO_03770 [Niabella soli DSM 19437]